MQRRFRPRKNYSRPLLCKKTFSDKLPERIVSSGITVMISRMNLCVDLGSTGYPFGLAIKVVAGRNKKRVGSAVQRARSRGLGGHGGVRSNAGDG